MVVSFVIFFRILLHCSAMPVVKIMVDIHVLFSTLVKMQLIFPGYL